MVAVGHPIALHDMQGQLHRMRVEWRPEAKPIHRTYASRRTSTSATGEIGPLNSHEHQARRSSFCFSQFSQVTSNINMRLLPSITSHCILSVYLLSAALLNIVVVANPIPISSRALISGSEDMRIRLAWRIPGGNFRSVQNGFSAHDRFYLFMTGSSFSTGFSIEDSTKTKRTQVIGVSLPLTPGRQIDDAALKDLAVGKKHLIAHFVDPSFFNQHYEVIRDVDRLREQTNALLKKKAEEFKGSTMRGDPGLQHPIDIIGDDLDWINTVLLYLTLINQPVRNVPVLDPQGLFVWSKILKEMTSMRSPR
ncbi:hypothetical protein DFJ43DRAFT_1158866 [Lentinula guzmanii]|uniref:Uncharacterized protein n=1 Tax=Lentinula guzmanii TaxID=2804957 RepID=A0AA38MW81_9AGAR|nr:hypothetical protein DFJ43DRAFT_1158866 [Lentinula guzmanii]